MGFLRFLFLIIDLKFRELSSEIFFNSREFCGLTLENLSKTLGVVIVLAKWLTFFKLSFTKLIILDLKDFISLNLTSFLEGWTFTSTSEKGH